MDKLEVAEISADHPARPDALAEMLSGELMAVIIRGVFSPDLLEAAADSVESGRVSLPLISVPILKGRIYGRPLAASRSDLSDYLDDAVIFRDGCRKLFGESPALDQRIQQALQRISRGLPVEPARSADGREFSPATLRVLVAGDTLSPHAENQTLRQPSFARLLEIIDQRRIVSFYIPVRIPESGGILTVISEDTFHDGDGAIGRLGTAPAMEAFVASGSTTIQPGVGDCLVFEGGRRYHWVTAVEGPRARWTLGGFLAPSRDHSRILYWS